MLDIFTLLNLEEWENDDENSENSDSVGDIIGDWEDVIYENPESPSELSISGELIASYPGLQVVPEHGLTIDGIMNYSPDLSDNYWNRQELTDVVEGKVEELTATKSPIWTEISH
jgi:hypothetical protein